MSKINETVSTEQVEALNSLFECYDQNDQEDGQYIDLPLNPERYTGLCTSNFADALLMTTLFLTFCGTGYKGEEAHRIWRSIYEENCFLQASGTKPPFSSGNICYEENLFYKAISGLHSSINIHLCALYLFMDGSFTFNKHEFVKRFKGRLMSPNLRLLHIFCYINFIVQAIIHILFI